MFIRRLNSANWGRISMIPLIKIIIPIYNNERYIRRCMESILMQTERRFLVVIVDDGSTDRSGSICDEYAAEYTDRIHVIHQENKGLSAARNIALDDETECKYVTFVDSDDWIHPRYLERLLRAAESTEAEIAIGRHVKTVEMLSVDDTEPEVCVCSPEEAYCMKSISTTPVWSKLFLSELWENIRFPLGKIYEEYYTTWKLIFSASRIAVVDQDLYFYFVNENGIVHSQWNGRRMDLFPALDEKIDFFEKNHFHKAEARARFKKSRMLEKFIEKVKLLDCADEYLVLLLEMKNGEMKYDTKNDGDND